MVVIARLHFILTDGFFFFSFLFCRLSFVFMAVCMSCLFVYVHWLIQSVSFCLSSEVVCLFAAFAGLLRLPFLFLSMLSRKVDQGKDDWPKLPSFSVSRLGDCVFCVCVSFFMFCS